MLPCDAGGPGSFPGRCRHIRTWIVERVPAGRLSQPRAQPPPPPGLATAITYMLLKDTHDENRLNDSSEGVRDPALSLKYPIFVLMITKLADILPLEF